MSSAGNSDTGRVLVLINVSPDLEDVLVDWLLSRNDDTGFTTLHAAAHAGDHSALSMAEQVEGRKRVIQFQIQLSAADVDGFLAGLHASLPGARLPFWIIPLMRQGKLG